MSNTQSSPREVTALAVGLGILLAVPIALGVALPIVVLESPLVSIVAFAALVALFARVVAKDSSFQSL